MNVVDSCGWLEYIGDGPNADFYAPALEDRENLLVPSICLLEVYKRLRRLADEDAALAAVAVMRQARVVDLTPELALRAADLGLNHKLPLADSIVLATARAFKGVVWTQDADFEGLAGVRYRPKPK